MGRRPGVRRWPRARPNSTRLSGSGWQPSSRWSAVTAISDEVRVLRASRAGDARRCGPPRRPARQSNGRNPSHWGAAAASTTLTGRDRGPAYDRRPLPDTRSRGPIPPRTHPRYRPMAIEQETAGGDRRRDLDPADGHRRRDRRCRGWPDVRGRQPGDRRRRSPRRRSAARSTSTGGRGRPEGVRGPQGLGQLARRASAAGRLAKLGELVKKNSEELAQLESRNTGKPITSARGEIAGVWLVFDYYAGAREQDLRPDDPGREARPRHDPQGADRRRAG